MTNERAVCLNCMDGRVQIPVINWIKENSQVDHVDIITEPGMDGLLANPDQSLEDIKTKIQISIEKNNANVIFIVGHYDCKGNPVDDGTHKVNIQTSVDRLKKEFSDIPTIGLWVNQDCAVEKVV